MVGGLGRRQAGAGRGIPIAVLLLARQCSTLTPPQAPLGGGGFGGSVPSTHALATTTPWGFTSTFPAWLPSWGRGKQVVGKAKPLAGDGAALPRKIQGSLGRNPFAEGRQEIECGQGRLEGMGSLRGLGRVGPRRFLVSMLGGRDAGHLRGESRLMASSAQASGEVKGMGTWAENDLLPGHDGLTSGVLPNGLRYCIFPNKKPAGRFYVNLEVNAGSTDEEAHQRGLAHFLEHALFLGTEKFPTQTDMKRLLRRLGMAYNAYANAFTDFKSTVYTFSAPVRGRAKTVESSAGMFGGGGA